MPKYDKYEIYSHLIKVSDEEYDKLDDLEKKDYVNDGWGNIFKKPETGFTPLVSLEEDESIKFRYDFEHNRIDVFYVIKDEDGNSKDSYVESYEVQFNNFVDNPEYWYHIAAETLEDDLVSVHDEFNVKESVETDGNNHYEIVAETEFIPVDIEEDRFWFSNFNKYLDKFKNFVSNFKIEDEYLTQPFKITAEFDNRTINTTIKVESPLILSKEELLEVYDTVSEMLTRISPDENYTVKLNIIDIKEV